MRTSIFAKVLLFSLASLATWVVCAQIKAQLPTSQKRTSSKAVVPPPPMMAGKSAISQKAAVAFSNRTDLQRPIAAVSLSNFAVDSFDHQAVVKARAQVYDSRPGVYHLWSLRVLSPNQEVVVPRHIYRDQPIQNNPGRDMSPEFGEMIPLAPGNYLVEISMHAMDPNTAFEDHQFEGEGFNNTSNQCFAVRREVRVD